ncbi:hypothetical protein SDC9_171797 [bioreactor metagenome]|uniref:Uncharacterized protein n=1 Tax=bioreactor metagenome TaxID=1076179 RepID=A0A645GF41_9ZZZZ
MVAEKTVRFRFLRLLPAAETGHVANGAVGQGDLQFVNPPFLHLILARNHRAAAGWNSKRDLFGRHRVHMKIAQRQSHRAFHHCRGWIFDRNFSMKCFPRFHNGRLRVQLLQRETQGTKRIGG